MKWCKNCILPDTRPNLVIGEDGVCNGCKATVEKSEEINWSKRENEFKEVIDYAKSRSKGYDCLIPVSGGKDSTWQVVRCLEYGLNPLCLTWRTPARTSIGQENLDNMISLGVDHIDYQVNPKVEAKFLIKSLDRFGSTGIPMHMALFNMPLRAAVKFDIPLVIWGENSGFEYGGADDETKGHRLSREWLQKFGVTHGTSATDWIDEDLTEKNMTPYYGPSDDELDEKGIRAIFLGHYFNWDPLMTYEVAKSHGFKERKEGAKLGLYDFADIDDDFISLHHYLKWHKFGFTRLFDNLSLEIRNSRLSRERAIEIVKEKGDQTPHSDIEKFCQFTGLSKDDFYQLCEKHRNLDVWEKVGDEWRIRDFLIEDWNWS